MASAQIALAKNLDFDKVIHSPVVTYQKVFKLQPRKSGNVKNLSHTVESKVVQDSMIAMNLVDLSVEKYLGGGMAVQSYLPSHRLHRPTRDVDFTFRQPL